MKPRVPGQVFERLTKVNALLRPKKVLLTRTQSYDLGRFSLGFDWLSRALEKARKDRRYRSYPELGEPEESEVCRLIGSSVVEVLADEQVAFILVDRWPVAQYDRRGEWILVESFVCPPLEEREKQMLHTLDASDTYFCFRHEENGILLCHVRQEEGQLNALRMIRSVRLRSGETDMFVEVDRSSIEKAPTLKNLIDWMGVRQGETHRNALDIHDNEP